MNNFSISINKQGSFLELSCIHKGLKISKVYHGYSMADAIKLFQEYLKDGFSINYFKLISNINQGEQSPYFMEN